MRQKKENLRNTKRQVRSVDQFTTNPIIFAIFQLPA